MVHVNRVRRRAASRKGFTLLEILLVVGLLALLAAFAIPALQKQGENAKKKLAEAAVGSGGVISKQIIAYQFAVGRYPESLKDLFEKPNDEKLAKKWDGPYLESKDGIVDPWGEEYQYQFPGTHNTDKFDLWSLGHDGKEGNDDICNWKQE